MSTHILAAPPKVPAIMTSLPPPVSVTRQPTPLPSRKCETYGFRSPLVTLIANDNVVYKQPGLRCQFPHFLCHRHMPHARQSEPPILMTRPRFRHLRELHAGPIFNELLELDDAGLCCRAASLVHFAVPPVPLLPPLAVDAHTDDHCLSA